MGSYALTLLASLTLSLSTPERNVLVGEPVKLVLTWGATSRVPGVVIEDSEFAFSTLEFVVDGGTGPRRYREILRNMGMQDAVRVWGDLEPARPHVVNYVLLEGTYQEPGTPASAGIRSTIFPAPGSYSLRAVYIDRRNRSAIATSNPVSFEVAASPDEETPVLALLNNEPRLVDAVGDLRRLREVLRTHGSSRYLRWAKVQYFEQLGDELRNNTDPETGESWWRLPKAEARANRRAAAQRITNEIADGGNWGPFEEERLWLLARYARSAGDMTLSEWARNEIKERFSSSMAAAGVKEWEDTVREARIFDAETNDTPPPANDTTPPVLTLSVSPSSLWPPNHGMVTVNLTVNATDNVDPHPAVKLVSITCDDGCDPAVDVAGAAVDTDDRQFQLRAERSGGGPGRTYTITYSAKDAAGNVAAKATTVVVPHDQGKKK